MALLAILSFTGANGSIGELGKGQFGALKDGLQGGNRIPNVGISQSKFGGALFVMVHLVYHAGRFSFIKAETKIG